METKSQKTTKLSREKQFIEACKIGDLDQVKFLHSLGVDLNCSDEYDFPALMWSIKRKQKRVALYLIEQKCDVNISSKWGQTPLMVASEESMIDVMKSLIEAGADIYAQDNHGFLASMYACRSDSIETFKFFAERYDDIFNYRDNEGNSHLMIAAKNESKNGYNELASYIYSLGKEKVCAQNFEGRNVLAYAISNNAYFFVEEILNDGVEIWKDSNVFRYANSIECVEILIRYGFDINDINAKHQTVLFLNSGNKIYEYFLSLDGVDINKIDVDGKNAICEHYFNYDRIEMLLKKGANVLEGSCKEGTTWGYVAKKYIMFSFNAFNRKQILRMIKRAEIKQRLKKLIKR